jgi:hypothetical protein
MDVKACSMLRQCLVTGERRGQSTSFPSRKMPMKRLSGLTTGERPTRMSSGLLSSDADVARLFVVCLSNPA